MKYDLYFASHGAGRIHGCRWEPQGQPKGVVQIIHGIAEHIDRFESVAIYLNSLGYVVVAEDHMGHGRSISEECPQGYFHGGWFAAVDDTMALMKYTMRKYPGLPYIMIGISMGSFMLRTILAKYPHSGISGAVICGTAWQDAAVLRAGKTLCGLICRTSNETKPNAFLQNMLFGSYNKGIPNPASQNAWLCRDEDVVNAYDEDPLCGFAASSGLYRDMMEGLSYIQNGENLTAMEKDLPVLFIAGDRDPVGNYGRGVEACAEAFRQNGMERVSVRIYPGYRHDILNEVDKLTVWTDLRDWLEESVVSIRYELMD